MMFKREVVHGGCLNCGRRALTVDFFFILVREPAFRPNLQFVLVVRPGLRWRKEKRTVEEESERGTDDVNLRRCLSLLFSASSGVFSFFTCVLGSYRHDKPGTLFFYIYIYKAYSDRRCSAIFKEEKENICSCVVRIFRMQ